MAPKKGYQKGYVTNRVKAFAAKFYADTGKFPTTEIVRKGIPDLGGADITVRKALQVFRESVPKSHVGQPLEYPEMPPAPAPADSESTLKRRLAEVRYQMDVLMVRARETGAVDAHQFDKLSRLERQLIEWERADSEEIKKQKQDAGHLPAFDRIFRTAEARKMQGLTRSGAEDGVRNVG